MAIEVVALLLGLEPSALMHARKVPSIEQYPQALHGYEQCPKLREGWKKLCHFLSAVPESLSEAK